MIQRRLNYIALILALVCIFACRGFGDDTAKLTILHTNDRHGRVFQYEFVDMDKSEWTVGGFARLASMICSARAASDCPVLVLDAGDIFTRGPVADMLGKPEIAMMNAVPYDAMTLGNNEFQGASGLDGQKILFERISEAKFPVLCANAFYESTGKSIVQPYKIFDCAGVRVGVVGLTAPRVATYGQASGLRIDDPIIAAKKIIEDMRGKCDFIVALTHVGYPLDLALASSLPEIDVVIGGDTHTALFHPTLVENNRNGTVVCQAGSYGQYLGRVDLTLAKQPDGRYRVSKWTGDLIRVDTKAKPAEDITAILDTYTQSLKKQIGTLQQPVKAKNASMWAAKRLKEATGAQVSVVLGTETGLPAGPITDLDVRKMVPLDSSIVVLSVTGKQLKEYKAAKDAPLWGAHYKGDDFLVDGKKVKDDDIYTLAIENMCVPYSSMLSGVPSASTGKTLREILADAVAK